MKTLTVRHEQNQYCTDFYNCDSVEGIVGSSKLLKNDTYEGMFKSLYMVQCQKDIIRIASF